MVAVGVAVVVVVGIGVGVAVGVGIAVVVVVVVAVGVAVGVVVEGAVGVIQGSSEPRLSTDTVRGTKRVTDIAPLNSAK